VRSEAHLQLLPSVPDERDLPQGVGGVVEVNHLGRHRGDAVPVSVSTMCEWECGGECEV
jgi:hypothetical protein